MFATLDNTAQIPATRRVSTRKYNEIDPVSLPRPSNFDCMKASILEWDSLVLLVVVDLLTLSCVKGMDAANRMLCQQRRDSR